MTPFMRIYGRQWRAWLPELGIPLSQLEERLAGLADLRDLTVEFELPIGLT